MENINREQESESTIKLRAFSDFIEEIRLRKKTIDSLKEYVEIEEKKYKFSKSLYARCIKEIYKFLHLENDQFIRSCMYCVNEYLSYATGKVYNSTVYNNDYRKKHYKQLNIDIPIEIMEEFEEKLKKEKKSKKEVILNLIENYIHDK